MIPVDAQVDDRGTRRRTRQAAHSAVPLALAWGVGVLLLWFALGRTEVDDAQLFLDPAAIAGLPWHTGLISNLGILAWTLATAAAASAAHTSRLGGRHGAARFLRQATFVTALVALDDLFLLHSTVFPKVLGLPKPATLSIYATLGLLWIVGNTGEIVRTRWGLLVAAGATMVASTMVDQLASGQSWALLTEDGAKFLGALAWAAYFTMTARDITSSVVRELSAGSPSEQRADGGLARSPAGSRR